MAASTAVFLEYEEVLQREAERAAHGRSEQEVARFLSTLSLKLVPVDI